MGYALTIAATIFLILTIVFWSRYFQIQNSLSNIVRCLNLIHQLILSMH